MRRRRSGWNDPLAPETLLYAALLALLAAAIVGVVPALKATGPQMQSRLKSAGARVRHEVRRRLDRRDRRAGCRHRRCS